MTGAWNGGLALSNAVDIGAVTATSNTILLPGNGSTTYAKGVWVQMVAAAATDTAWISIVGQTINSGGSTFAVDIGIGASGSEVVVINNLNFSSNPGEGRRYFFPFMIAAGTRIAARMSSNSLGDTIPIHMETFQDQFTSVGVGSGLDTYGFSNATNLGTAIDPGATPNTKGAYTQITASVTSDLAGFLFQIDGRDQSTGTAGIVWWLFDIAVGASGSEVVILPNLYQAAYVSGLCNLLIPMSFYIPMQIGAGTRIAVRSQCSTANSPDRILGFTFYGVRL